MVVLPPPSSENVDGGLQPKTRLEYFLNKIAENGGSGSGDGVQVVHIDLKPEEVIKVNVSIGGSSSNVPAIRYNIPDGDSIFMVRYWFDVVNMDAELVTRISVREYAGVDPDLVREGDYTFAGIKTLLSLPINSVETIIIPTSVELIPGTKGGR